MIGELICVFAVPQPLEKVVKVLTLAGWKRHCLRLSFFYSMWIDGLLNGTGRSWAPWSSPAKMTNKCPINLQGDCYCAKLNANDAEQPQRKYKTSTVMKSKDNDLKVMQNDHKCLLHVCSSNSLAPIDGLVGIKKKSVISYGKSSAPLDICLFLWTLSNSLVAQVKQLHLEASLFLQVWKYCSTCFTFGANVANSGISISNQF